MVAASSSTDSPRSGLSRGNDYSFLNNRDTMKTGLSTASLRPRLWRPGVPPATSEKEELPLLVDRGAGIAALAGDGIDKGQIS
jgi:hypothetical protein